MYASRIVEVADSQKLFAEPLHPYTQGLLKSLPRLGFSGKRLQMISGTVPEPLHFPSGCKFHPRCPIGCSDRRCQTIEPPLRRVQVEDPVETLKAVTFRADSESARIESLFLEAGEIVSFIRILLPENLAGGPQ